MQNLTELERFEAMVARIHATPWGRDADITYHKDNRWMVFNTDIGKINYYMPNGKFQVRSHLFGVKSDDDFFDFIQCLCTTGLYMWSPNWSSRKDEQDPEFLAKVVHPFIERAKPTT